MIKKNTAYSLLAAVLTTIVITLILLGQRFLGNNSFWVAVAMAFVVSLFLQPLREIGQKIVDRLFYRSGYDYQRIISRYSRALTRPVTDLDQYAKMASYLLGKSMQLAGTSVMVLDREARHYLVRAADGEGEKAVGIAVPEDSALIKEITVHYSEIDREEIAGRLKNPALTTAEKERLSSVLEEMDKLRAVLIIPSVSESEYFSKPTLLSTINLGRKLSNESYSADDIEFLKTIGNQSAISVEYTFILEELKKKQDQVMRSEKMAALGSTIAGIAHELKNPLTYLLTVTQSMEANWDKEAFKASVVKMLPSEVERMKLIIEGLSDYSKAHELRIEPVAVAEVIEKVLLIMGYDVNKNKVFIVKNYALEGDEKAVAMADKNRLVQVFMNIISNAIQAMGEKGGDLTVTIRQEGKEVRVSVSDTGPGISKEKLQRIFDPFFTTKEAGTGLGLSITKKIIDEHKGSIYVDSFEGEGTTFTVCLPRA